MSDASREPKYLERIAMARIILGLAIMQGITLVAVAILIAESSGYLCRF